MATKKNNKTKNAPAPPVRFIVPIDDTMKRMIGSVGFDLGTPAHFIEREPNPGDLVLALVAGKVRAGAVWGPDSAGCMQLTDYRETLLIAEKDWQCLGVWDV